MRVVQRQIGLDLDFDERLRVYCERRGISVSAWVRVALARALDDALRVERARKARQ